MGKFGKIAAAGTAAAIVALALAPAPARAVAPGDVATAEKLRKLDIMLMVTSLRCRTGADDFQSDYQAFSRARIATMQGAYRVMTDSLTRRHGAAGAKRAVDRISVGMANRYGQGHPWLACGQLKQVTRELSRSGGETELVVAADHLLADQRPVQFAMVD